MRIILHWALLFVAALILLTVPAMAADNTVTIPWGDWLNAVLEFAAAILMLAIGGLIGALVKFLPAWLQPMITAQVQAALAGWIRQAIHYAIQQVEGFDKGKTITFDVGSGALAVAVRFLIDHAPSWLLKLAGGPEKLKAQILAQLSEHGITLASGVQPADVSAATAIAASGVESQLKKIFAGK